MARQRMTRLGTGITEAVSQRYGQAGDGSTSECIDRLLLKDLRVAGRLALSANG